MLARIALLLATIPLFAACEKDPPQKATSSEAVATTKDPEVAAQPKSTPPGPPELRIDEFGPKVGFDTVLIEKKDGRERLHKAIEAVKAQFEGKHLELTVARRARTLWVAAMVDELDQIGAKGIVIHTDTRAEFSNSMPFVLQSQVQDAPQCSLVLTILEDRATAVWKLSGGTASRRSRGFAGPDLSMTAETIERRAKECKESSTYFVSAAEPIEWGLTYDLAASAQKVPGVKLDRVVLLRDIPVAGRVVKLK